MRYRIFVHNHFWLECQYITEVTHEIANLVYGGVDTSAITPGLYENGWAHLTNGSLAECRRYIERNM